MELMGLRVLVLVFSVVFHEVAHGWIALRLGDTTARDAGRLTLNPLPHVDIFGSIVVPIMLAVAGGIPFGWAKPVPVRPDRLNDPWNDQPRVAAAGPASNILLATLAAIGLGLTVGLGGTPSWMHGAAAQPDAGSFLYELFRFGILLNVVLALFNLVPVPPLDGSWILQRFLPPEARVRYFGLRRFGLFPVVAFLVLARYTPLGGVLQGALGLAILPFEGLARGIARMIL
ncbi:MAG: site-2 protease family protein [bacterium]|nr:site-2 protease family protein [bacterium]